MSSQFFKAGIALNSRIVQHGPGTLFQVLIMEHQGDGNRERGGNACDTAGTPTHLPSNRKSGALLFLLLPHAQCPMINKILFHSQEEG